MYGKYLKRIVDFLAALILSVLLSPVFLILFFVVRIKLGAPVIFRQERPGRDEKIFTMYKFRTMDHSVGPDGNLLPDSERITKTGTFLRKSSMDELPELFNILKGDMSFVGPRPLLVRYLNRYNKFQKRRHEVRPGLTGYAQINGRNTISWEQKFEYDVHYVDHISFVFDLKILLGTISKVLKGKGVSQEGEATMSEFIGSETGDNHDEKGK